MKVSRELRNGILLFALIEFFVIVAFIVVKLKGG